MKFLKNLFTLSDEKTDLPDGWVSQKNDDGSESFLLRTADTESQPFRTLLGSVIDAEGLTWEVSAAPNAVWLYNVDDNDYVVFDLIGGNDFANLLSDAVKHAHLV